MDPRDNLSLREQKWIVIPILVTGVVLLVAVVAAGALGVIR